MIVALLADHERNPSALVFEDHWFDNASIHLLTSVTRLLPRLLVVASRRPHNASTVDPEPQKEPDNLIGIRLGAMTKRPIEELIRRKLLASELAGPLVSFVYQHGGGNPFHCEELALALRDTGAISVTRGVCEVLADLS